MQKLKLMSNYPSILENQFQVTKGLSAVGQKKTRMTLIGSTAMRLLARIKKRLSPITPFLLINLRPRLLKSVKKVGKEVLQPLELMLVAKKDKDKAKDLSYVKCYTCK